MTVVLAFHGTRHPDGVPTAWAIAGRVSDALGGRDVRVGWVNVHDRLLADTLAEAGDCTLVPCFLAAGYHVHTDVPDAVAASPHHVRVTRHLGGLLTAAVVDRVREAGPLPDAVVLAAAGSRHAGATAEVEAAASALAGELGVEVRPGSVYGGPLPTVAEAVAGLRESGHSDVLLSPYALAPGLWADRIAGLSCRTAAPLADHPAVVAAIAGLVADVVTPVSTTLGRVVQ